MFAFSIYFAKRYFSMEVAQGTPNRLQTTADIFEPQKGRAEKYYRLVADKFCFLLPQLNPKNRLGWG